MLDPLRDEPHAVPDHERSQAAPPGTFLLTSDQDAVAACEERLHRVPVHRDHPQVAGPGPKLGVDKRIGEQPRARSVSRRVRPAASGARTGAGSQGR